ncbi:Zn-dependent M28 family amino/carboxypeptidase [Tamaricihabitans halophyticus]|uniref:Zn-dependent M28 family amino/carboxypeptidase n=1 Tax=Tamaricihabitans halophyticus TaxID=1262583 RepID=A0A4R2R2M0_9PSEU|nr:M28 family metallopeptidase [Tamaricihabitans halophyticus]TCP57000.1 Zn-dependent M28 family amino/carboxypeptidase [Tamaricihabitans halophyticus]
MAVSRRALRTGATGLMLTAGLVLTCAPAGAENTPADLPDQLAEKVTADGLQRHLIALQRIADRNDGNRAAGTSGYDASLDYMAGKLTAAGFEVSTPTFDAATHEVTSESLAVSGKDIEVRTMTFAATTDEDGVRGPLAVVPESDATGCTAADYGSADYTDTIALIRRGGCDFAVKQRAAADAGAIGALISNNEPGILNGTLGGPENAVIPTGGISQADGDALADQSGAEVTFVTVSTTSEFTERNLIAQTRTGRADNVVTAGAHLDGVFDGPGINDNGSGSVALLETALKLGGSPDVPNAVRFAWWGAEEFGLQGSTKYVQSLSFEQQLDIAMYLNFDMVGSPNAGYFVYDGSGEEFGEPGPVGSDDIQNAFTRYFDSTGIATEPTEFDGRSDYLEFVNSGIPSGGLFTGGDGTKTEEQAAKWGGQAGENFDPCYHQKCDNLRNIDRTALERNAKAIAYVTASYGLSTEGVNGVPSREQRAQLRADTPKMATATAGSGSEQVR